MRVIFFYPGEEGTYVDHANVILFENGIVHIYSAQEETTTHLQNCEILWKFELEKEDRAASKVRLLKPKGESPHPQNVANHPSGATANSDPGETPRAVDSSRTSPETQGQPDPESPPKGGGFPFRSR